MNILIGADPEMFMKKDGSFVSAYGMIKGDKKNPFKVKDGAVQVDGMALEFNIDPASSELEFVHNITSVMEQLKAMVPEFEVIAQPTATFTPEYMKAQPKEALELGCEPDFNAWNDGAVNVKPNQDKPMRTGAGHIHIGWTTDADITDPSHLVDCIEITKMLDAYLGIPSLMLDEDRERRTMYGQAGCFRPKPYGVEYRVLSNFWLKSPELMAWVYKTTQLALKNLLNNHKVPHRVGYNARAAMQYEGIRAEHITRYIKGELPNV